MLDILKKEAGTGDQIKLFLISGQEPQGEILEISGSYIRLLTNEGKDTRLFDKLIGGWEILDSNKKEHQKEKTTEPTDVINLEDKTPKTSEKKESFQKTTKDEHCDEGIEKPTLPGLKIVGKIDLDKIQPKISKRKNEISKTNSIRLIRAAKDLNLPMSQLVELAEEISIKVQPKSSFLISENDFKKIKNYYSTTFKKIELTKGQSNKNSLRLNSLGDLKNLKEKIITEEGKTFLPPNGTIKRYGRNGYGFITDHENNDYFFRFSTIEDKDLLEKLENSQNEIGTAVVCSFHNNSGKLTATNVRLSEPIENLIEQAQELYDNGDKKSSQDLLLLVIDSFPDYVPATSLLNKIKYDHSKSKKTKQNASNSYFRAKSELSRGNIEAAKNYFEEALDLNDHRSENVVKELAYLYQREGNWSKSVELVKANSDKFNSSDPNSFIAFFYESERIYDKAVEFLEKVKSGSRNDNIKLIKRKANAYYRLDKYDEAEQLIKEVLKEQPEDRISQKILEGLEQARISGRYEEELEVFFNEAELFSFSGGLSPFTRYMLERCEYEGIPASEIRDESFSESTLKQLRNLIGRMGKRPKERATYLLTEAKVIERVNPELESERSSALTRYYTSFADYASIESFPVDIVRFLLLEASKLTKTIESISTHLPIYLYSFLENSHEAQKRREAKLDPSLKECLDRNAMKVLDGLADIFATNSNLFSTLLSRLFSKDSLKKHAVVYLNEQLNDQFDTKIKQETFKKAWTEVVERRQIEKQGLYSKFSSLNEIQNTEQFAESFSALKYKLDQFSQTDRYRINSISELVENVYEFNKQVDFEDKERIHNLIQVKISHLIGEIEESPTDFSFNILRNLSSQLERLLKKEFSQVVSTSSPELDLRIAGEGILHNSDNLVSFQVIISNKRGSAPVSPFELTIEDSDDYTLEVSSGKSDGTLKGGQERPIKLNLVKTKGSSELSALPITVVCNYKVRGSEEDKEFKKTLSLRFYSEVEFERIENPFATTADSGPVEDPSMFFGREEFLENVTESILGSGAKCIIIYGQKRSGKSSVLFHLRERLDNDSKAFCIQFSLGEIIEDLSSEVFYYKVLSEIEDSLDILREEGYLVPDFKCPNLNDLSKAPAIVFNEQLKVLRKRMQSIEGWSNKKLVLLLDEFTYIYTAIKRGILSDQFMKSWKSFLEKGHFTSVLIGQDIMPKFTSAYPNEFGVTEPRRLSYLRKSDAKKLIEKPVWDTKRNQSRFIGNALDLILDYTSSNPYYIQIFCARMIEHMNRIKAITATEADVEEVALSYIKGADALTPDKFDNLITAGDAEVESFPPQQVLMALKEIALATKNLSSCSRDALKSKEAVTDEILEDLQTREVIDCPQPDYYKINVRLFKEWLLKN